MKKPRIVIEGWPAVTAFWLFVFALVMYNIGFVLYLCGVR